MKRNLKTRLGYPACVGCGYCCKKTPCGAALLILKERAAAPCPLLLPRPDGTYRCGAVAKFKGQQRRSLMRSLAIGAGCSSPLFNAYRQKIVARMGE